ncbi:hypothetical protein JKF63_00296 [Porcisia hertigi]|uniref:Uncharacterized protein n=1 Tax=Porcisia hertigi TaxID=2761500 RepID=A0A836KY75_9TRYP|nr:hypothetical protein JKF63_00296 [Porcisia hertigi]
MRLLKALHSFKKYTDLQAECLHLLLALIQLTGLPASPGVVVASEDEAVQLAMLCTDVCGAKRDVALRPQNASMQLLGCLCGKPEYARALSRETVEKISRCFLDVATNLTQQRKVNQALGEGLLRGLTGFLGSFPLCCEEDAPVLTLINNIVLSALTLNEGSSNYTVCLSALFLFRHRASDTFAPFTLLCADEYSATLKALWMHRHKGIRRESRAAAAVFWSTLCSQLLQCHSSGVRRVGTSHKADTSHTLHVILGVLLQSLDSSADRGASYALEALYHLFPAVAALNGPEALQAMSTRLEERVGILLATTSALQTEALFRQVPYLLASIGQLLSLLPSVSLRQQAMVQELLNWILLFYPHPKFYDREKTVPSIVAVITALMHHPRTPAHTAPRLLSMRTLELVGAAPSAAVMTLADEQIPIEERLNYMAALWARLLTPCEASSTEAKTESQHRLSTAFYRACKDFCDQAQLDVVVVATGNSDATLERILVEGADGLHPRTPTEYCAFLSFVDFFVRFSEKLRRSDRTVHPPVREMIEWLETLVRGARAAPHVSGFYTLIHRTVLGEKLCPCLSRPEQPHLTTPLESKSSDVIRDGHTDDHPCVSPPLRLFLDTECLRKMYLYNGELLYQCAMCVVVGAAFVGNDERDEMRGIGAQVGGPRLLDAYVRAFKVVVEATPTPLDDGDATGETEKALWCFGNSSAVLEGNRHCALRVVEEKSSRSPRWAAAVLPELTNALRSAGLVTAVQTSVQMLAARHGVQITAELPHNRKKTTPARFCGGEWTTNSLGGGMPRWMATMEPVTVPLIVGDSALHIGYLTPLASKLGLHSKQPAVRTAAAEVLYWCIVWAIATRVRYWDSVVVSSFLSLASLTSTIDRRGVTVHHKLHELLMHTARWFGRAAATPQEAESFVFGLLRGLGEEDATQRRVAAEALVAYAIPPADGPQTVTHHCQAVLEQLVTMECSSSEWPQLGAAQCVHLMIRRLCEAKVPGLVRIAHAVLRGVIGCLRRCTGALLWGTMENATCNRLQETLRCVVVYYRSLRELENDVGQREGVQDAVDLVRAASAVLSGLAQRHTGCAIALLQALHALMHVSANVHQPMSLSQYLIREERLRLSSAAAGSVDSVVRGCAALVALFRSGCCTEHNVRVLTEAAPPVCSARREDCTVAPELLCLLTTVLQSIAEEARVATHENRCVSPPLLEWLLKLIDVVPEQTHTTHFAQLFTPTVIAQTVRLMVAGATVTVTDETEKDDRDTCADVLHRSCDLSLRLPKMVRLCLGLIQFIMRITADQEIHQTRVIEEVLCAIRSTSVFHLFTEASLLSQLVNAPSIDPTLPVVGPVTLAAALSQVDVPCSSFPQTMWALVADSMGISPKTIVGMLLALLRNPAALNTTSGEEVCGGLLLLFLNETDPVSLCPHLRDLLVPDAVQHDGSLTSFPIPGFPEKNHGAGAASPSAISGSALLDRSFESVITHRLQKASAALPTDRLVSVLPALMTVVVPETLRRSPSEAGLLLRLVGNWLAELQGRSLTSEHDQALCRVCAETVAVERAIRDITQTGEQVDDRGDARLAVLLTLVEVLGPSICNSQSLSQALCNLCLCLGKPANMYKVLSSIVATNRVVWSFHMLSAMITPRPVSRSLAVVLPVDSEIVKVASDFLNEILNNALPLRWTELRTPLEEKNGAELVRSGTALFAAVLPHNVRVLEAMVPILAKESMPQRNMIAREVRRALQKLCSSAPVLQLDAFACVSRLLRDPRTHPDICDALTNGVLLPLLHATAEGVRLRLFEEEIGYWVAEAGKPPVLGRFSVPTAALACLALMHHLCPLVDLRGSINAAFTRGDPNATGKEVTQEVLKACRAAWVPRNTGGDDADGKADCSVGNNAHAERLCRHRQAAFRCLTATLSQTQQAEKIFCQCFFQPRSVSGWNALFLVKRDDVAVASSAGTAEEEEAPMEPGGVDPTLTPLWRIMDSCDIPKLFAHLIRHFPSSSAAPNEPPAWVLHFVGIAQQPELCLSVKLVFYRIVCVNERFFGTFARHIFDGVADSIAAVPPSEPAGKVVWALLSVLVKWLHQGGLETSAAAKTSSLKAMARYAVLHYAWEHSLPACGGGSRALDPTSLKTLAELLKQIPRTSGATPVSLSTSSPLTVAEVRTLLSDPVYERRACLEVIHVVASTCGGLGGTGDSHEVVVVYELLGTLLDASASPPLYLGTARLVGLEHRLLSEAAIRGPPSAAINFLLDSLQGIVCAVMGGCDSDKKYLDVIAEMQAHRSEALVYQLLSRTNLLHQYSTQKVSEKQLTLRVLARASTYVADNYDSIHVRLTRQLCGVHSDLLLGIYTVVRNALPKLAMESVRHVLRDVCRCDALQPLQSAEQARVAFYEMCVLALRRWTVLREEEKMCDMGANIGADVEMFVMRRGLCDPSLTVQSLVLDYIDLHAARVPDTMWEHLSCLFTADNLKNGDADSSSRRWVRHYAVLLLSLARRSPNYVNPIYYFSEPLSVKGLPPMLRTRVPLAVEGSDARWRRRQPQSTPLFSEAMLHGGKSCSATASTVLPATSPFPQSYASHSLVPQSPQKQQTLLCPTGLRASGRRGLDTTLRHGAGTIFTSTETQHRRQIGSGDLEPNDKAASARDKASREIEDMRWLRAANGAALGDPQSGVAAPSAAPLLGTHANGRFPEVRLTLKSLLAPLHVLCLHDDEIAARVLFDLITNASVATHSTNHPLDARLLRVTPSLLSCLQLKPR